MLVKVEARTIQGDLLSLPLDDISSGFTVEEIEGLDPVKASIVSSSFAGMDGELYQSSHRETRNIKMKLALRPESELDTVRDLRKQLYKFFMPKAPVSLRFYSEDLDVDIVGWVETCETPLFAKDPVVDISIICLDPDFFNPVKTVFSQMTSENPGSYDVLEYEGTTTTGFVFTLNLDRDLDEFTIYHRDPNGDIKSLEFSTPLLTGDTLFISTIPGDKGATVIRAGSVVPVLYAISPQSTWLELTSGTNEILVYATGADIPYSIEYNEKYGGL